jgi:multidrug efflux pump subunit AcrB
MFNLASRTRPYFGAITLTALLLVGGGVYSALRMPSGIYPEVSFSRIALVAKVAGLGVPNMEVQVTRPLEEELRTIPGLAIVRSKTIRGATEISLDFNPGTDMIRAEQFTWNHIGTARSKLPKDIDLTVDRMTPSVFPILSIALVGGENPMQLRDYAYYTLAPRIKNVPDVLYANVSGGDVREIAVEPRPDDLLAVGLSASDLADRLSQVHIIQPVGRVERQPFAFQMLVDTQGETPEKIANLVIASRTNQVIRVRDVADVRVSHEDRTQSIGYRGQDAVAISVFRAIGGNTVQVSQNVHNLLDTWRLPANIRATIVYDQAMFVNTAVFNVRDAIIIGSLFSILILLAFLRSWRATLISALAIPTTLAITLLFLRWTGETLNLMSLGGLAVAIGLIIDDTVVVIENIARHLERKPPTGAASPSANGQPAPDPIDAASSEITGAVVGSSLTTVLVFVPLAFIVGVYGQFFAALTWSLSIAVLVSMVISLTLIPVFAARFLAGRAMPAPGPLYNFLAHWYEKALSVALRFPFATLFVSVAALGIGYVLYAGIPSPAASVEGKKPAPLVRGVETGLMPEMDEGAFVLDYFAPTGMSLEQTTAMARKIEKILDENPDVQTYLRRTGSENGIFATQTNRGDFTVILRPAPETPWAIWRQPLRPKMDNQAFEKERAQLGKAGVRKKYRRRSAADIMDEVREAVKDVYSEHQLLVETVPIMQDELNDLSGADKPIEVQIFGPDYPTLRELAVKVGEKLDKPNNGLEDVDSHVRGDNPDLLIRPNLRAAGHDLSPTLLQQQLGTMYFGRVATQVRESSLRLTDVVVRYPDRLRFGTGVFDPDAVLRQWILLPPITTAPADKQPAFQPLQGLSRAVPLSAVSGVERVHSPDEQWRQNQTPAIFVTASLNSKEGGLGTAVANIRRWLAEVPMPPGYHWDIGGHYLKQQAAFSSLALVMVVAIFLLYIMLAFQFRSVLLPLTIFLTEPLSLVSGLFALWITHTPLNVSSYMGMILLIGLDMKNGILIVEYVQQLRAEGMPLRQALLVAGRTRFRPILMTSLAAILGLFPLALGIGPGAQMQQPLAIMVIGGLTANMLFTRMIIPVAYLVLDRAHEDRSPPPPAVPAQLPALLPVVPGQAG